MTFFKPDDLAVITGPVEFSDGQISGLHLHPGEVVQIIHTADEDGDVFVLGHESDRESFITESSLSPFDEVVTGLEDTSDDPRWGDLIDYNDIHDFVYEGDE